MYDRAMWGRATSHRAAVIGGKELNRRKYRVCPEKRRPFSKISMRVLIATDGSDYSQEAVERYLDTFADPADTVKIVSVVEPVTHIVGAPFGVVDNYYNAYISEARTAANSHNTRAGNAVAAKVGKNNITEEVIIGSPGRSIVESASEWGADLILMGSHGRGFWQRVYLGSVSAAVVHHAPCSVLIVRAPHLDSKRSEQTQ